MASIWELASEYDIEVIVNADAHRPQDLQKMTSDAEALRLQLQLIGDGSDVVSVQ